MRILAKDIGAEEGKVAEFMGWIATRRDHGKLIFLDLRDRTGIVQVVCVPAVLGAGQEVASQVRNEWVVRIKGEVKKRPEAMVNKNIPNGEFELAATEFEILSEAKTPPIEVSGDGYEIGEESRMKYRYLDLRRERLQKNLRNRDKITGFIRNHLREQDFVEVETPVLSKSTPEGARDYLVPSRVYPGKFYALPQSPQQYKQLLMSAGIERYFQIARCFRDEDTRGDRQPEFTQLDLEMSFVSREDVMAANEELLIALVKKLYPGKKIQETPFPRISYAEAMEKYGTDRPDLRKDKEDKDLLAFCWVIDFPFFEKVEASAAHSEASAKEWTFTHNPFSAPKPEHMEWLMEKKNIGDIVTTQYDVVLNGFEIGGGSIRNHQAEALKKVFEVMGFEDERIENNFGHMLEALSSGTPPHGGIAWGLDRFVMLLENEPNIREVIAFPKSGDGRDFLMDSPSEVSKDQLRDLGIELRKEKK